MVLLKRLITILKSWQNKISDISNFATKILVNKVENRIPEISNLNKKTDYNTKITTIENKLNNHNHENILKLLKI